MKQPMDYVRQGEIQVRYLVFFKAHGPVFYHVWHSPKNIWFCSRKCVIKSYIIGAVIVVMYIIHKWFSSSIPKRPYSGSTDFVCILHSLLSCIINPLCFYTKCNGFKETFILSRSPDLPLHRQLLHRIVIWIFLFWVSDNSFLSLMWVM